jgi:hypothetical protein
LVSKEAIMNKRRLLVLLIVVLIIGFGMFLPVAKYVLANGYATRQATNAEKDFQVKTKATIRKAIPPALAGLEIIGEDKLIAQDHVCR